MSMTMMMTTKIIILLSDAMKRDRMYLTIVYLFLPFSKAIDAIELDDLKDHFSCLKPF